MPHSDDLPEAAIRTADESHREPPFGAPYVFVLLVVDGEDASVAHRVTHPETLIGRGDECHFVIEEERVSRVHCKLRVEGPVLTIADAGSRNGTWVNGRRIAPNVGHRLRNLDEIEVGSHRLLLLSGRFRHQNKKAPV
jgi:pSer/pThr/pTyr-binding forkhead associated (FHA) protein